MVYLIKNIHKLLLLVIIISAQSILAQEFNSVSIHGKVVDKNSGRPLENVNIMIANTTIGTSTNSHGYFEINRLPKGTFYLIISHVSYNFQKKKLHLVKKYNDLKYFKLSKKTYQLPTVVITAEDPELWHERMETFKEWFIGETMNADSTNIVNPFVIDLWEADGILFAASGYPIEIINKSLGYKLQYFLEHFEAGYDYTKYSGVAVFEELVAESPAIQYFWKVRREETYLNSLRHFLTVLNQSYDSNNDHLLNEEGYYISILQVSPWRPWIIPSFSPSIKLKEFISPSPMFSERYLKFDDFLGVYYSPMFDISKPRSIYLSRYLDESQISAIELDADSVMIDIKGRYCDEFKLHTYGEFARHRVADMLPYEYEPD